MKTSKHIIALVLFSVIFSIDSPHFLRAETNSPAIKPEHQGTIRIACVGDSITQGIHTMNMRLDAYPSQLQRMLGKDWIVGNFGVSGHTLLNKGDQPYQKTRTFTDALHFNPDLVVIMLGTNDAKDKNWQFKSEFIADYKSLIEEFKALPSHPRIFICRPPPLPKDGKQEIPAAPLDEQVPLLESIARDEQVAIIDMHAPLVDHMDLITDRIHPGTAGSNLLAKTVYRSLTGKDFTGTLDPFLRTQWNGYDRIEFPLGSEVGSIVYPNSPAQGARWVWRLGGMGYDPQFDLALLQKGYAVASIPLPNLYGSQTVMDAMDRAYEELTRNHQICSKPILEAYGPDGLGAINWAIRHPERLAGIYLDGAVLDFKSWPGGVTLGKGKGPGSLKDWADLKKAYGFADDAAAVAYQENPLDNLSPIVRAKIPIVSVSGTADQRIPAKENAAILEQRYKALGGEILPISVPGRNENAHGLKDPSDAVAFLIKNSQP
jgi:lysophospholipase L1-like esterase